MAGAFRLGATTLAPSVATDLRGFVGGGDVVDHAAGERREGKGVSPAGRPRGTGHGPAPYPHCSSGTKGNRWSVRRPWCMDWSVEGQVKAFRSTGLAGGDYHLSVNVQWKTGPFLVAVW